MKEKTARKMGEVHAFACVALDTCERARAALIAAYGDAGYAQIVDSNTRDRDTLESLAQEAAVAEAVLAKSESTQAKLKTMRDLYIKDEWDNPTELLEWNGFFEGAAVVHWALVGGAAGALNHTALMSLSEQALKYHEEVLASGKQALAEVGKSIES